MGISGTRGILPACKGSRLLLGFTYARRPRIIYKVHGRDIGHGADLTFGFVKRRFLTERVRSEAGWNPTQEALQPINLSQWQQAKGYAGCAISEWYQGFTGMAPCS